ncbi:MAG: DUF559 domain-containing protein [Pseudolysinimonas sp.]
MHGLWMLTQPSLHVEAIRGDSRFRTPENPELAIPMTQRDDVVLHWVRPEDRSPRLGQRLPVALRHMATCVPPFDAICAIDSALHRGLVSRPDLDAGADHATVRILSLCDGSAESGVESVFRVRARLAGFVFRTQVEMPAGRVDFVIGDRLIVEVDGSEHHSGRAAFIADRERDAIHVALGYKVVRFTYSQVITRWHEVESVLTLLHARGQHLWPSSRIRR